MTEETPRAVPGHKARSFGRAVSAANRLWLFVCASAALHAIVLAELPVLTARVEQESAPLSAQLVESEPPAPPAPPPPPPKAPPPARKAPVVAVRPAPSVIEPVRSAEPPPEAPAVEAEGDVASEPPDAAPQLAQAKPEPALPPQAEPDPSPAPEKPKLQGDLPGNGSISFTAYLGADGVTIGRTVQTWQFSKDNYRLTSFSETTGLIGLFRPYQLGYVSEGRVDASGLRPELFSVRRGRSGDRQYAARFDWAAKQLTLGPENATHTVALPEEAHDMLSFIYQLALTPLAPGRVLLNITNGNKLDRYTLDIGAEETIQLPIGAVRAVPIRQVRSPGQESIEIWLAAERRHLPVRIRFFDREGRMSGEQVAAEITADGN